MTRPEDPLHGRHPGSTRDIDRVGIFTPKHVLLDELGPGEMGFITAAIKDISETKVGDTITEERNPAPQALPGFKPSIPMVFCSLFPVDSSEFEKLHEIHRQAEAQPDAALHYEAGSSRRRSAWVSAAASSAFCTWRS